MKKLLLSLVLAVPMMAQLPTYNLAAPFNCDASATRPVTSFYQFDCRGVSFTNPNDGREVANGFRSVHPHILTGTLQFE